MPPVAIAAGAVIVAGAAGAAASANQRRIQGEKAASAQQSIAQAQQSQAERERNQILGMGQKGLNELEQAYYMAEPSGADLKNLERQIQLYERTLSVQEAALERQKKFAQTIDPGIVEAGQQILAALQGKDVAALNPLKAQRSRDRALLEEQLKQNLGSGYAGTTAGAQALSRFDQQTSEMLQSAQMSTVGQLGAAATGLTNISNQGLQGAFSGAQTLSGLSQEEFNRRNALTQRAVSARQAYGAGLFQQAGLARQASLVDYAGAGNVAALGAAQARANQWAGMQQTGNQLVGIGGSMLGGAMGGGGGAAGSLGGMGAQAPAANQFQYQSQYFGTMK